MPNITQDGRTPAGAMMTRRQALAAGGAALVGVAAAACGGTAPAGGSGQNQSPAPASPAAAPSVAPAPSANAAPGVARSSGGASSSSWDALVAAAKPEGTVVVSGPADPGADTQIPAAFKQAYGIDVEYLSTSSSQVAARVQSERAAGQYTLDVMLAGSDTIYGTVLANGWLDPLKPALIQPEVADASKWSTSGLWFRDPDGDKVLQVLNAIAPTPLTVNTQLVSVDEVSDSSALLDPKWKGKIGAFDPGANGPGIVTAASMYITKGQDFAAALYQGQQVALSRDYGQVADWVAHGSYPIVLAATHALLLRYEQANLPIVETSFQDIPAATAGAFGLVTLMNNAPHPNAARVFANWIASKDGLALFAQLDSSAPVRNDIEVTWLPADQIPQPGVQYFDTYEYQYASTQRLQLRDYFANLLK